MNTGTTMVDAVTLSIPERQVRSPCRKKQWIVTCSDDNAYESMLVPFVGSLISLARWDGSIVVLDFGLSLSRVERLRDLGIVVEKARCNHNVVLDRFLYLGGFALRRGGLIAHWDADVWFTGSVSELFDTYHREHSGRLVCTIDPVFQQSFYSVASGELQLRKMRGVFQRLIQMLGHVLQCGFLCGDAVVMQKFSRYLQHLVSAGEVRPSWGSDAVGLSYFCYEHPHLVDVVDSGYNCLPDCQPERLGQHYFLQGRQVRALHLTSPWRGSEDGQNYRFQKVYPELHQLWMERLRTTG